MTNNKPRLLLVGADDQFRSSLKSQLENEGHQVLESVDATRALELLDEQKVDLIVTDLMVPEIERLDLLTFLTHRLPEVPVIVISASATERNGIEALHRGAFDFLAQPLQREKLLLIIRQALELHDLREENRLLKEEISEQYLRRLGVSRPGRTQPGIDHALDDHGSTRDDEESADTGWFADRLLDTGIPLAEVERQLIMMALERHNGNQTRAAKALGITRNTIIYRMRKYGISQVSK